MVELLVDEFDGDDAVLQGLGRVVDVAVLREVGSPEAEERMRKALVLETQNEHEWTRPWKKWLLTPYDMAAACDQTWAPRRGSVGNAVVRNW